MCQQQQQRTLACQQLTACRHSLHPHSQPRRHIMLLVVYTARLLVVCPNLEMLMRNSSRYERK